MRKDTENFIQSAEYDLETAKYKMSKRKGEEEIGKRKILEKWNLIYRES